MVRVLEPEIMDDPGLAPDEHAGALAGLARLNAVSFAARAVYRQTRSVASAMRGPVRVVDVGTGSADVLVGVCLAARRDGLDLRATACDISAFALRAATARAERAGVPIDTARLDAVEDEIPEGDVVISSLFLHHLAEHQASRVLESMRRAARAGIVVSDLRRCGWGTALAAVVPRVMTRSRVVHVDAVRSARAAFSVLELRDLADRAGLEGAVIRRAWPARMMLGWSR